MPTQSTRRTGPLLSDGTPVADLIDLERRDASLRLFHDPEILALEARRLFGRTWQVVGHETEVPEYGDFVMRHVGTDPVVMTRGPDGAISVFLNVCTHRGMQVCRSDCGTTTTFRCAYHGWVFDTEGSLRGAPFEREMYGTALDRSELGLRRARVETYAGIVFANWDRDAPSLTEFLGGYTWYLDTIFKRSKRGLRMLGAPQRFVVKANWKAAAEQFSGADGYHLMTLHRSLIEVYMLRQGDDYNAIARQLIQGVSIGDDLGHGVHCINYRENAGPALAGLSPDDLATMSPLELLTRAPLDGMPPDLVAELADTMTPGQLRVMTTFTPRNGGIFPNGAFLSTQLRTYVPRGVDRFELINWPLVEADAPLEYQRRLRKQMLHMFGTSGIVEQDDAEAWPGIQASVGGYMGRHDRMRYLGFRDGQPPEPGWGAESTAQTFTGFSKDDSAWLWWQRYREMLTGRRD